MTPSAFIRTKKDEAINPGTNKNLFFTKRNNDVYVICTEWPKEQITLKNVKSGNNIKVVFLGTEEPVRIKAQGNSLAIIPPVLTPDDHQLAYVFRISGMTR